MPKKHKKHKKFNFFSQMYWHLWKNVVIYKGVVSITVMWAISSGGRALDF